MFLVVGALMGSLPIIAKHVVPLLERFAKKTSDSLIRSFLVSDLRNLLTSLISGERPERLADIAL